MIVIKKYNCILLMSQKSEWILKSGFVSLHHITLFWSAEIVVLFWLYQKSFIKLLKIASLIITVLMLISLLMDWVQVYGNVTGVIPAIINRGFITTIVSAVAMFLYLLC